MKKLIRSIPQAIGIFAMALGTLLLPSCAEEQYIDVQDDEAVEMVIKLGHKTRTANSGDSTVWIDGDELTVIHAPENGNTFWSSRFSWISDNAFSGKVSRLSSKNDWYVVYPYMEQNTAANQISLTFPSAQTQTGYDNKAHFSGPQFPMIGKKTGVSRSTDLSLQMQNILSAAEFKVTNTTDAPIIVKQVQFTAPSPVAGAFTVDMTADDYVISAASGATRTVTLSVAEGTEIAAGKTALVYMAVAPFEAPAGSELAISTVAVHPSAPDVLLTDDYTITLDKATSFSSGSIKTVNVAFEEPVVTERTYKLVSSITDGGTYLIAGRETAQDRVGLYICAFPPVGNNNCEHIKLGTNYDQETIVSSEYTNYEVVLIASGSKWLVKVKNTGKYMYFSNGVISFTDDPTLALAAQSITTNNNYPACIKDNNNYEFYHSGSNACFMYSQNKGANNLRFYQLEDTRSPQTLVFSPESATYNLGTQSWVTSVPSLSGYSTPVTYSSSDTSVATVDETSGVVTPISKGTAIITATAAESSLYQSGSASYTLTVKNSTSASGKFVRVTSIDEINTDGEYVIVYESGSTVKAFKPILNSSKNAFSTSSDNAINVTITDDEIESSEVEDCRFTLTKQDGTNLKFALVVPEADGVEDYYFVVRYSSSGSGTSFYASTTQDGYRSTFSLSESGVLSLVGNSSYNFRYSSSSNAFQASTSSSSNLYLFVRSDGTGKRKQTITFDESTVRWVVGEGQNHQINISYEFPQTAKGAQTDVTYSCEPESIAKIENGKIKIVGIGTATITATAKETEEYYGASASYSLRISEPVSGDFVELEGSPFNLENSKLTQFLDAASTAYNDNNVTSSSSSIVTTYAPSGSTLDVPNPVTIKWDAASSGQATITILDDDQATVVWTQTATSGSKSSDVYNLIPGKTYYCTVEDSSGYLLKGMFQTTGRRRMIKVSDTTTNTHARNCRDLGGMKTIDGKTIKYGMIYRGTNLDSTTDTEQDLMANYLGIGWDIDLRQSSEGSAHFASKYNVTYVMCNYSSSVSSDHLTNPTKVKKTIDAFFAAAAAGKASYFHCAIGADRTGYWGLLIEGLLGVSASDCSIDYEMTSFASGITQNSWGTIGTRTRGTGNFSAGLSFFNGYAGETLQKKITNFLVNDCNVKSEDIEAFKNNVLE